ncbi:hypothetical protein BDW60DRAFT_207367 [Aspergillus nidulans var. acristatus]
MPTEIPIRVLTQEKMSSAQGSLILTVREEITPAVSAPLLERRPVAAKAASVAMARHTAVTAVSRSATQRPNAENSQTRLMLDAPLNVCCSQYGFCGTTAEFCGDGCQSNCVQPKPSPQATNSQRRIVPRR